jgi:arginyl-tRNA--protein-N-Asp/Glu arginylyltransferase
MTLPTQNARFYYSAPAPCPYIQGRIERRIFADLCGPNAAFSYELLSEAGFRRSLGFAYRPACPGCNACVPVRIPVAEFKNERSWRRVNAVNSDLVTLQVKPRATPEQFALFCRYQQMRHHDGEMARMSMADYQTMVEVGAMDSMVVELRDTDGTLVAACLTDRMLKGLSAVYSFFDPEQGRRSLGSCLILRLIDIARERGLEHVYLGYWIEDSRKMAYKARFKPLEALTREGWKPLEI